jgi:hypothetical protein
VAAENRLSSEQLAALVPGDTVTVELSGDFRRPRRSSGTVVRIEGACLVVSERSPRGVPYVERYSRRDGLRIGRGSIAHLVDADADGLPTDDVRRRQLRVDAAYRAWSRDRADLGKLRELQAAIGAVMDDGRAGAAHP